MAMLSGRDAGLIAQGVYAVLPASGSADALKIGGMEPRLNQRSTTGPNLSQPVKPVAGLMGSSGAFMKKETGFGLLLEKSGPDGKELIVAFRGSQSNNDWLSNLNVGLDVGPSGCLIHAGFNRIYKSMQDELAREISIAKPAQIHFVGHSLGGALASIAAADFIGGGRFPGYLYTFGAPRVGSLGLASVLERTLPATQVKRVYAISDPVPMLPLLPFRHFGPGSTALRDGFQTICSDAHKMQTSYLPSMPETGWPPNLVLPYRTDPDYWLGQAASSGSISKGFGYLCLSQALSLILGAANAINLVLSPSITILDRLVDGLANAALLAGKLGASVLKFVKTAMTLIGRAALVASLEAADLTASFLRRVLELLFAPVKAAAELARGNLL